jgi:hypothetical protein
VTVSAAILTSIHPRPLYLLSTPAAFSGELHRIGELLLDRPVAGVAMPGARRIRP